MKGRIVAFLESLFGVSTRNLYIEQLKSDLDECRHVRDYFRSRCDRLELLLLPNQVQRERKPIDVRPSGRKSWAQVQQENSEKIKKEIEAEQAKARN